MRVLVIFCWSVYAAVGCSGRQGRLQLHAIPANMDHSGAGLQHCSTAAGHCREYNPVIAWEVETGARLQCSAPWVLREREY